GDPRTVLERRHPPDPRDRQAGARELHAARRVAREPNLRRFTIIIRLWRRTFDGWKTTQSRRAELVDVAVGAGKGGRERRHQLDAPETGGRDALARARELVPRVE